MTVKICWCILEWLQIQQSRRSKMRSGREVWEGPVKVWLSRHKTSCYFTLRRISAQRCCRAPGLQFKGLLCGGLSSYLKISKEQSLLSLPFTPKAQWVKNIVLQKNNWENQESKSSMIFTYIKKKNSIFPKKKSLIIRKDKRIKDMNHCYALNLCTQWGNYWDFNLQVQFANTRFPS